MSDESPIPRDGFVRTFVGPSGRTWQVFIEYLAPMQTATGQSPVTRAVLRFRAEDLTLELQDWPANWETMDEHALVQLARSAKTPSGLPYKPGRPSQGPSLRR